MCIGQLNFSENDMQEDLVDGFNIFKCICICFNSMIYIPGVSWDDEAHYFPR